MGDAVEKQLAAICEIIAGVLRNPPQAARNVTEWAKQQACRKIALETPVPLAAGFDHFVISGGQKRSIRKQQKAEGTIDRGLDALK